jgi:integration host factor subunit beta
MPTKLTFAALASSVALCACSSVVDWGPESGLMPPAEDVVAIGRLENLESEPNSFDPDDLLEHGWFSANFHVSRIEPGDLTGRVVPVRYFGHTWLREDIAYRFRLRRSESGGYVICARRGSIGYNCDPGEGL